MQAPPTTGTRLPRPTLHAAANLTESIHQHLVRHCPAVTENLKDQQDNCHGNLNVDGPPADTMHVDIPNPGPDRQQAKQTDIIYNALQKLLPRSMPAISNKYFASSSVRFATKKLILKIRTHSLWTAAYALKINKPYKTSAGSRDDGRCPLCCTSSSPGPLTGDRMRRDPLRDSAAHILGSCRHADMAALYTERHNQALLLVHRALMQSVSPQPCIVLITPPAKHNCPRGSTATDSQHGSSRA
jgi:hypothetical protein